MTQKRIDGTDCHDSVVYNFPVMMVRGKNLRQLNLETNSLCGIPVADIKKLTSGK